MTRPTRPTPSKVVRTEELRATLAAERARGRTVAFTNGCYDVLHAGHMHLLESAANLADILVVGLNSDASVRRLKGTGRPFVSFDDRALLLAALEVVDWVVGFDEDTPASLIAALEPQLLVKGGDWSPDRIVGRATVEALGGRVVSIPLVSGRSTTALVERIRATAGPARSDGSS